MSIYFYIKMINLGKVLVLEGKHLLELERVPERVRTDTIYNYALHQIDGTGWRPDYALQALALLQSQDLSSYDLSFFDNLQGISISNGRIKFNLEGLIKSGYEKIKKRKNTEVGLGILKFAQEQGADINPRRLIAYGLKKLQKDLFEGLHLLEEAKEKGLIKDILTLEAGKFIPTINVDKPLSENELRRIRLEAYINSRVEELAKQGDFATVELIPRMYRKLDLSINKEAFEKRIEKIAFSMIQQGNGEGLDYFFPPFFQKGDLLKDKDLSKVIEDGYRRLEKGEGEKGVRILKQAKFGGSDINLTENQQEIIKNCLFNKIKKLNNWFDSMSLKSYIDDIKSLKLAFSEEDNKLIKNTFLEKLKKLRKKSFPYLSFYLDSCDHAGINFDDVCTVAYTRLEKGRISEGLEILASALQKYPIDKYAEETGDRFLLKHFSSRNVAPFKRKIKRNLAKKGLDLQVLDISFEQVKDGNYAEGMDNLMKVGDIGIRPNFIERMTPNEMVEVAYKTMETKFMFYYGLKLLKQAVKQGAEVEQDIVRYLNKLGKNSFC